MEHSPNIPRVFSGASVANVKRRLHVRGHTDQVLKVGLKLYEGASESLTFGQLKECNGNAE